MFELAPQRRGQRGRLHPAADPAAESRGRERSIGLIHPEIQQSPRIARVASEGLVTPLPGENNRHPFARQPRDKIKRNAGRPHQRFVFVPDQFRQRFEELLAAEPHFVMVRADMAGDLSRVTQLAELFFAVANRECLNLVAANFRGQGRNRAGVQPATEKNSQRHVAHQV